MSTKIKPYAKTVYPDSNGVEHETMEQAQKAQNEIDKVNFANEFVNQVIELPSIQSCCTMQTRQKLNGMTGDNLLRILIQDMPAFRDLINKNIHKAKKLGMIVEHTKSPAI